MMEPLKPAAASAACVSAADSACTSAAGASAVSAAGADDAGVLEDELHPARPIVNTAAPKIAIDF